jgi:protein-disulfide isomerase
MQKQISWVLALVVGVAIGFFAKSALVGGAGGPTVRPAVPPPGAAAQRPARPQEDPKAVYKVELGDSPVKGPADALVTIVESSDFECPFCKRVGPTLKQLEQAFPGKLRFSFKHNPLPFHQRALPAALAAEEARAQKGDAGFWAMHDALFDSAPALDDAALERAGAAAGLDVARLRTALAQKTHEPRIRRDQQLVTGLGATGTPAFFINGRKLSGAQPFENFRVVVEEELRKAEALVAAGTPRAGLYAAVIAKGATAAVMLPAAPGQAAPAAPPAPPATVYRKVTVRPDDPARGPADAKLTVVLFSDFQCPFCSRVEPTLKELEGAFPGQVRVVWKHQPLPFHPNARPAAMAAEAAREQGKFWQMHEKLFANQQQLSAAAYEGWAKELGLDLGKFKASMAASRGEARIAEDQALGRQVGADGTPTMFFNCRQVVGALPIGAMRPIVEEELRKADALLAKGAKRGPGFHAEACDANVAAAPQPAVRPAAAPGAAVEAGPVRVELRPDDPVKGNPRAPVTVVVFSDFQCPYCSRVEPTLAQVEKVYGDKVRIAWKHKPLPFHPHAIPAAEAAEAAREQGKFWQMHDKMFAAQQDLSPASYERWARELGLDMGRFKAAIASGKFKARIQEDDALAGRLGIDGTPTLVINGEKVVGAQPFEAMKVVIDRQLARK